ncbi:hypothetical protein Dacsa_2761 [Dactylococcopsis salina PCC 8305]|uniref:Uncharacterized protein n=1 Tax=Dactylococcopsis salina (strain PCC 8305) TaxID=13035 RepID=K9YYY9_DACS8|nr:hypothetical protein Dacsa_2761 [Dactylococcopsis salina PCC 8305]
MRYSFDLKSYSLIIYSLLIYLDPLKSSRYLHLVIPTEK